MTAVPKPQKTALEADTDQALAWAREARDSTDGLGGDYARHMASGMAEQIRAEFPGANAGRLVAAVATSLNALADIWKDMGADPDMGVLMGIALLAALELDETESQS
jgi:hypothetical protein